MPTTHEATATWRGDLSSGKGGVSVKSGALRNAATSWAERTEGTGSAGASSPEELLAAAHASCFSMALSARLAKNDTPPSQLDVRAEVTFDNASGGWKVTA
jgi:osmotically inducible protein OsmC